jgi:hypothetical protein
MLAAGWVDDYQVHYECVGVLPAAPSKLGMHGPPIVGAVEVALWCIWLLWMLGQISRLGLYAQQAANLASWNRMEP